MIEKDIEKILISKEEILMKSAELGKQLTGEHRRENPLMVDILKGVVPFMAGLTRKISTYLELDLMNVSSYGNVTVPSGEVKTIKDLDASVEGRHILIIEDIVDNGRTLTYLVDLFRYRRAASMRIVTLLDKPEGRVVDIEADYVGSDVPDESVAGYGLDYTETYCDLPYIDVLKPETYEPN